MVACHWPRAALSGGAANQRAPSGGGGVAGAGNRGEEVGGGWLMIGGTDFKDEEGEGPKWHGGGLYKVRGARVRGFEAVSEPFDLDRTTRS